MKNMHIIKKIDEVILQKTDGVDIGTFSGIISKDKMKNIIYNLFTEYIVLGTTLFTIYLQK